MQYPSTPSSSRSVRLPSTPPTQTGRGHATPGAPYMSARDLPPSPYTPGSATPGPQPATPYMGTVPLPQHQLSNPYGLLTPPASPAWPRNQLALNPILTPQYASAVTFDMRRPVEEIRCDPACLDALATHPGTDCLSLVVFFDTIRVEVRNPRGVTVRDVFYRLHRELNKPAPGAPARRIDLIAPCVYFGGINYTGEGFSLVVRAHAP
ncbi:hypothetical protein BDW22DRAFT_825196 [Trametopsis cervina]|nr:hypothetical protein BDW22DRAFT_825196 [Trametopsis cervina]